MRFRNVLGIFVVLLILVGCSASAPSPSVQRNTLLATTNVTAFPGAEGYGSRSIGGRGGQVIYVDNLNDSGTGSLRAALAQSGPRNIIFRVGGTITLQSDVTVSNPFVTIAGHTAPGDGIQLRNGMIKVRTHDVIIRFLKVRAGDVQNASSTQDRDAVSVNTARTYNVIIDHSSLVWGPDVGGVTILTDAHDITVQDSIIGEGLYLSTHPEGTTAEKGHSYAVNVSSLSSSQTVKNVTLYHNLITTSDSRNPRLQGSEYVDMVNNVVYNFGTRASHGNPKRLNLVNNAYVKGPMTRTDLIWGIQSSSDFPTIFSQSVYEAGNQGIGFTPKRSSSSSVYVSSRFEPYSVRTTTSAQDAYNTISAGKIGAYLPVQDPVDARILTNLRNRTGSFLNGNQLTWPLLKNGTAYIDTDKDGIADTWEQGMFGGLSRNGTQDSNGNGYTDLEEFLESLIAGSSTEPTPAAETPTVVPATQTPVTVTPTNVSTATATTAPTVSPTATATPSGSGLWLSTQELAALPMSGTPWTNLKTAADASWGSANLSDLNSRHDTFALAGALVYARTGQSTYRTKVANAIMSAIGTEAASRGLEVSRNITSYVIAADLINFRSFDLTRESQFRTWLTGLRTKRMTDGRTIVSTQEDRPNNWGTMASAARVAIDLYIGDKTDLQRAATVFKGYLGDRTAYTGFSYGPLDWQCDPTKPVGINPTGCVKQGLNIDGVLPDDQRRGGGFTTNPPNENYVWEALQGAVVASYMLDRAGYGTWNASDKALLRAVSWQFNINKYPPDGDDTWITWIINKAYGTSFPTSPASVGKNMGYTDWTFSR